jgi:hypothetical protein
MGLASFPVAELTNIGIANVDTAAKAIAENADIAIGAKVRMLENVIAKNVSEPLKRAIAAGERREPGPRAYRVLAPGGRYAFGVWDADHQPVGRIADESQPDFSRPIRRRRKRRPPGSGRPRIAGSPPLDLAEEGKGSENSVLSASLCGGNDLPH